MISSFPSNPRANMAGVKSFKFTPYQNVAKLPPAQRKILVKQAVELKAGALWHEGYSTINEALLNEVASKDEGGTIYDVQVTGFVPGNYEDLLDLMVSMEACRHILLLTDHSGRARFVGYKAPLDFTASFGTGKVAGVDAKGFNYSFYTQSRMRSPFFLV